MNPTDRTSRRKILLLLASAPLAGCASHREKLQQALEQANHPALVEAIRTAPDDWLGFDELLTAIKRNRVAHARMLLDAGVPLRHPRWDITALTTAAYNGHKELVDLFLGRGATVAERESALTLEPRPTSERGNYIASDRDWPREEAHNLGGLLETLAKSGNPEAISLARQLLTPKSSHTYFLRRAEGVGDSALSSAVRGNQFALATHLLDRGAPTDLNVVVRDPIFPVLQILSRSEQSRILRTRNVSVNMKFAGEDGYFRKHGIRVETNVPGTVPHVTQSLEDLLAAAKDPRFVAILRR